MRAIILIVPFLFMSLSGCATRTRSLILGGAGGVAIGGFTGSAVYSGPEKRIQNRNALMGAGIGLGVGLLSCATCCRCTCAAWSSTVVQRRRRRSQLYTSVQWAESPHQAQIPTTFPHCSAQPSARPPADGAPGFVFAVPTPAAS